MMQEHILHLYSGVLGARHEATLTTKFNLACDVGKQGRLEEAEMLKVDVLSAQAELLGANHPSTIHTMASLARSYMQREKYNEALGLMTKALHLSENVLGFGHPRTQEKREMLEQWLSELNRDDITQHHILEAEEQTEALLQERYSRSLSECMLEIHFQKACQVQARAESGEDGTAKQLLLSKKLVAASRIWVANDSTFGIRTIGKILSLMKRDADAQVAFEGVIERNSKSEESSTYSLRSEASGDTHNFPAGKSPESSKDDMGASDVEIVHGQRNQQDSREVVSEEEIVSDIESLTNADGQKVLRGHLSESSSNGSNGSVCGHTEDVEESGGAAIDVEQNRLGVSSGHESNVWGNTAWRDSASCDGCEKVFHLPSIRYFCIECSYIDLCEACYDKLQLEGTLESDEMEDCRGHRFLSAPRPEWYNLPWGVVSEYGTTLREWAEKLIAEFTE